MLSEVNEVQVFLKKKFGNGVVPEGDYAVPTMTSKGKAFMKVTVKDEKLFGFDLYWDEDFKHSWYTEAKPKRKSKR